MILARILAIAAGTAILAAVAHVNIIVTGGYGTPHAYVTIAVAGGVAVAALVTGFAWSQSRRLLALSLLACMICGEAYQLLGTAERLVKAREVEQAPLREQQIAYTKAKKRVETAERAVNDLPITTKAIETAEAAKARVDAAVLEKSAERGCRENCRQLLQAQVDNAAEAVRLATAALVAIKEGANRELRVARDALGQAKPPESPTALADRTGIPAWVIDLVTSALGSISANGLACCLMIFGAHYSTSAGRTHVNAEIVETTYRHEPPPKRTSPPKQSNKAAQQAARFAVERLHPSDGYTPLAAIRQEFPRWCEFARIDEPAESAELAKALADLFRRTKLDVERIDGRLVVHGVALKTQAQAPPLRITNAARLGPMSRRARAGKSAGVQHT